MQHCLPEITPDCLTGAVLAVEGVIDAAAVLNGPTGCKFYHAAIADRMLMRNTSLDPLPYSMEFYFGQSRVPATYLDGHDYVFGAGQKLQRILPVVAAKGHKLIAVINTPGAALIGDDLQRVIEEADLGIPCVAVENPGFSGDLTEGFQQTLIRVLEAIHPHVQSPQPRCVNLLGMSIYHRHWEGSVQELTRLLGRCGISVNSVWAAGACVSDLQALHRAEANLVIHDEYGATLGEWIERRYGIPVLPVPPGAPLGFDATQQWLETICQQLAADPAPGIDALNQARIRAFTVLRRFNALTGLPKGVTFAVDADASLVLPLIQWAHCYLGMIPVAVRTPANSRRSRAVLEAFLSDHGFASALSIEPESVEADLVFASGAALSRIDRLGLSKGGIDIAEPGSGCIEVAPKALLGAEGALYLLELILNALHQLRR